MVNIRRSILGGLASLVLGFGSCSKDTAVEARAFYAKFPETASLNGAGNVEKYEVAGAQHCLVHIRQEHQVIPAHSLTPGLNLIELMKSDSTYMSNPENKTKVEALEEQYLVKRNEVLSILESVSRVQDDIYLILDSLIQNGLSFIRVEGADRDYTKEQAFDRFSKIINSLINNGYLTEDQANSRKFRMLGGADYALGIQEKVRIRAAEDPQLFAMATKRSREMKMNGSYELTDEMVDGREDFVLKMVNSADEPYSVVTFGGFHDFRDNVEEWNQKNPNDKFSLIVVTPKSYKPINHKKNK